MFFSGISDEAGQSIETQINAHKELGWEYLEIRLVDKVNLTDVSDEKFEGVCRRVNEAGMKVSCFASQLGNWARPITGDFQKDVDELKRAIPRMKQFDTKFIRAMSWPNDEKKPLSQMAWKNEAVRRLRELVKIATDGNIIIAHENCSGYGGQGAAQTLELMNEINSPHLRVVFDTGNFAGHGYTSWEYYLKVKHSISYIHIKDARNSKEEIYTFPGEGDGDVRKIIGDLIKTGYGGGLSIEPHTAVMIHSGGKNAGVDPYANYVEYGKRLMRLVQEIQITK
jgi:sugar phosphate isomerase/epimerase